MRAIAIGVVGAAVAVFAFGISELSGGLLGAIFATIAVCAALTTVGLMIGFGAVAIHERLSSPADEIDRRLAVSRRWLPARAERCGSCGRRMKPIGSLLVCEVCDHVTVGR